MKSKFICLGLLTISLGVTFFACQKELTTESEFKQFNNSSLSVESAKTYFEELIKKQGSAKIKYKGVGMLSDAKNEKSAVFSKPYIGENKLITFVEVPINYSRRLATTIKRVGEIDDKNMQKKIIEASFERLVIYKDKKTGLRSNKIVSFVPDAKYLSKNRGDISQSNHFNNLDKDFSGYLVYKTWNGKVTGVDKIEDGKVARNKSSNVVPNSAGKKESGKTNSFISVCEFECASFELELWVLICKDTDVMTGQPINCEWELAGWETITYCAPVTPAAGCIVLPNGAEEIDVPGGPAGAISCPAGPRDIESPFSSLNPSYGKDTTHVEFYLFGMNIVSGYSWMIYEDIVTHDEYVVEITTTPNYYNFPCMYFWNITVPLPSGIPVGQYYMKISVDGDVFYYEYPNSSALTMFTKRIFTVTP